jgi:aspartate kinase
MLRRLPFSRRRCKEMHRRLPLERGVHCVSLLIQQFGGSSVANADKILAAASRAIRAHRQGAQVVVVVSARGDTTDELIDLARQLSSHPPAREMDMLLSTGEQISVALMAVAIQALGAPAISFTGAQIGIVTDSFHTKARIRNISTERMLQALGEGKIVIVAGFQGIDEKYNITTLGRGGSDTTAVALAEVLGASACEIYTDVEGVYTTDPRIVPEARKIDRISYDEMLELASLGAGVMHSRSIEFAKKYGVPIHVRTSADDTPGTWIIGDIDARRLGYSVTGAALARDEARVTVVGFPDRPGTVYELFRRVAEAGIIVDMIVQNVAASRTTKVSFTVAASDLEETLRVAAATARKLGAGGVLHDADVAKISVVGLGMRTHAGVAATMFEALAQEGINIQMISTSDIKISVLVGRSAAAPALAAVHQAFDLHHPLDVAPVPFTPALHRRPARHTIALADSSGPATTPPAGMEDLVISGIELDKEQARITVHDVPDRPGHAARILLKVADADIIVDMIVQNISTMGSPNLSFTVRRQDLGRASEVAASIAGPGSLSVQPEIAKLSLLGVGMRSHTGVAMRMFGALAERGISPTLINTSEVRINVAVDLVQGSEAREALARAFLQHVPVS